MRWHWGPYGSQDHPGSLRAEDLVKRTDELGIPIADEKPDGGRAIIELWRSAGVAGVTAKVEWTGGKSRWVGEYLPEWSGRED
jgi:hypothetical protein